MDTINEETSTRITTKQMMILVTIRRGNTDGNLIDLDQLLERVQYEVTKSSMQFSIRALIKRGLVIKRGTEIRRGKSRMTYQLTPLAYSLIRGAEGALPDVPIDIETFSR